MLRKAYARLSEWSEKPHGEHLLFWFSLAESCVVPVPTDPLLLALCAGAPRRSLWFAFLCGFGSVAGGLLGYAIGYYAFDSIGTALLQLYDPDLEAFSQIETIYENWGFWGVLMAAITPIPYKIFTWASGVFHYSLVQFVVASIIGRNIRFFFVGGLMAFGGDRVKDWVESSSNWLLGSCLVMFLLGFVAVKFF